MFAEVIAATPPVTGSLAISAVTVAALPPVVAGLAHDERDRS
jgi:hypothetical protein